MAILYYGDGEVTVEGSNVRAVEINYKGKVKIDKTCGNGFDIVFNNTKIIIFPLGKGYLNNLFKYKGSLEVLSIIVAGDEGEIPSNIKKVMDYAELLNSNAEDITINSEDLKSNYVVGKVPSKTGVKKLFIEGEDIEKSKPRAINNKTNNTRSSY